MKTYYSIAGLALILLFLFSIETKVAAQQPSTTPADKEKTQADPAAKAAATPEPTPKPDFWHQSEMTGDWDGARTRLREKGVDLNFKFVNSYQAIVDGGLKRGNAYNAKFQTNFKFDLEKMAGWKFWSAEFKTEFRFADPVLGGAGGVNPINTFALIPALKGNVFAVTAANITKLVPIDLKKGDFVAFSVGRFNTIDLQDEDFFGGAGIERHLNLGGLAVLRQIPLIANGGSVAWIKRGEAFVTFAVFDPNDHSLDLGLSDLFKDGVTFIPGINFSSKYFGKSGKHSIGGAITTKKYSPFDAFRQFVPPGPPVRPIEPTRGSWSLGYTFRQYLVERGPRDGWGLYAAVSFADKDRSPVTTFLNVGVGGNGLFRKRNQDEFGVQYGYTGLSRSLKDNLDIIGLGGRVRGEHVVEAFYNFHLTPWLRFTTDLQIIRGVRRVSDRAIIPAARMVIVF